MRRKGLPHTKIPRVKPSQQNKHANTQHVPEEGVDSTHHRLEPIGSHQKPGTKHFLLCVFAVQARSDLDSEPSLHPLDVVARSGVEHLDLSWVLGLHLGIENAGAENAKRSGPWPSSSYQFTRKPKHRARTNARTNGAAETRPPGWKTRALTLDALKAITLLVLPNLILYHADKRRRELLITRPEVT